MRVGYEVFHRDVAVLVNFYVTVLGFEALPSDQGLVHVVVRRGAVRVGCTLDKSAPVDARHRRPPSGSEIVLRVEDVIAEYDHVNATRWPIADLLKEQSWGLRDFRIFDPSGQYLRITEDVRHATPGLDVGGTRPRGSRSRIAELGQAPEVPAGPDQVPGP